MKLSSAVLQSFSLLSIKSMTVDSFILLWTSDILDIIFLKKRSFSRDSSSVKINWESSSSLNFIYWPSY